MGVNNDKHVPSLVLFDAFLIGSLFFTIYIGLFDLIPGEDAYDLNITALSVEIAALGLLIGSIFSAVGGFGGHDCLFFVALIMTGLGVVSMFTAAMIFSYIHLIEFPYYGFTYAEMNERRAYWGSFGVSMVTGLVVPFVVLCLRCFMSKNGSGRAVVPHEPPPADEERQDPSEKEEVNAVES